MAAHDKITLRDAVDNPAWMMVYAAEPERNIDVTMTYADLFAIRNWICNLPQKAQKAQKAKVTVRKKDNSFD